ncbi:MAG TPA: DUF2752 domain-containing protein [Planctomycetaceae bacterium]|nr:DUF2752 domain-containing protein [Planctomycetaceae bacterium]
MRTVSTSEDSARRRRTHHRTMLLGAAAAIAGAFALTARSDGRVALWCLPGAPLPHSCASRAVWGADCAGCGLTRSFIYLAKGDLKASWRMHRLGWLMAIAVIGQVPYRLAALRRADGRPLGNWFPRAFGFMLVVLLIGNWIAGLLWR